MNQIRKKKVGKKKIVYLCCFILIWTVIITSNFGSIEVFAGNIFEGDVTQGALEKVISLNVWANTFINFDVSGSAITGYLLLDNNSFLAGQEIKIYLNDDSLGSAFTNEEGYFEKNLSLHNFSIGNYSLRSEFQGDALFYLNPSVEEKLVELNWVNDAWELKTIEVIGDNISHVNESLGNSSFITVNLDKSSYVQNENMKVSGQFVLNGEPASKNLELRIKFNETNVFTTNLSSIDGGYYYSFPANFVNEGSYILVISAGDLSAQTNFYFQIVPLGEVICNEFVENLLWSSDYSSDLSGSVNYDVWLPAHNCLKLNHSGCFLKDLEVKTRLVYSNPNVENGTGEGFIQISEPSSDICNSPKDGEYIQYLAYQSAKSEEYQWKRDCGQSKNYGNKCSEYDEKFDGGLCYGIKSSASQYSIIDAVEIKYSLCWKELTTNEL